MKISVVVCTYGRYDVLDMAVDSILAASRHIPQSAFEFLIVDNNPPELRKRVRVLKNRMIRVIDEDRVGLSHARNRGIKESTGDIVLFNDDDIIATEGYLASYLNFFENHPRHDVAGGKTLPHYEGQKPLWIDADLEKYLSVIDYGNKSRPVKAGEYLVGANLAFRKRVFAEYGTFNTDLGRQGSSSLLSNEETEFVKKLPGFPYYLADATVYHRIFPERLAKSWFQKRVSWQAVSDFLSDVRYDQKSLKSDLQQVETFKLTEQFAELAESEAFKLEIKSTYLNTHKLLSGF